MCGIAGAIGHLGAAREDELRRVGERMARALEHRGPDDGGVWTDPAMGLVLSHRRLSIVDVSPEGHQPMVSPDGRFVIVFNGEVYNFVELRDRLDSVGHAGWRGHSDTEVMLAAFTCWGVEGALEHFNGMFALAVWDRQDRVLQLARDRVGEKPLYHGWAGDTFLFGSELKALRAHPAWRGSVDQGALSLFVRHGYVPAPHSIYEGVRKLEPGCMLSLPCGHGITRGSESIRRYWDPHVTVSKAVVSPITGREEDAASALEELLQDAVRLRMRADVPLGAFLSGGIDSSLVVALMARSSGPVPRTFSIGFDDRRFDEAPHASAVARHLGTDHTELYVTPAQAMSVIPRLPEIYDEPFADSSQIPTFLVSQLARQDVLVALSGDGGDELFGGYNRYLWSDRIWRRIAGVPEPARRVVARALSSLSPHAWDRLARSILPLVPRPYRVNRPGDNIHRLASLLASRDPGDLYRRIVSHLEPSVVLAGGGAEPVYALTNMHEAPELEDFVQLMMYLDLVTYLPDDILVKTDRASMAVGLEVRVPLLDHRLVEFAWRLPTEWRVGGGVGKRLLRQVLYRYVPPAMMDRPKMGFGIPLDEWLRGPLRPWAESLLEPARLRAEGYFEAGVVEKAWSAHLSGRRNVAYQLWNVLMFQAWHEVYM